MLSIRVLRLSSSPALGPAQLARLCSVQPRPAVARQFFQGVSASGRVEFSRMSTTSGPSKRKVHCGVGSAAVMCGTELGGELELELGLHRRPRGSGSLEGCCGRRQVLQATIWPLDRGFRSTLWRPLSDGRARGASRLQRSRAETAALGLSTRPSSPPLPPATRLTTALRSTSSAHLLLLTPCRPCCRARS